MANVAKTDAEKAAAAAARKVEKANAFKKLAVARTNKALDAIASLRGLAVRTNYEYTDEQAAAIVKALEGAVVELASRFTNPNAAPSGFSLD